MPENESQNGKYERQEGVAPGRSGLPPPKSNGNNGGGRRPGVAYLQNRRAVEKEFERLYNELRFGEVVLNPKTGKPTGKKKPLDPQRGNARVATLKGALDSMKFTEQMAAKAVEEQLRQELAAIKREVAELADHLRSQGIIPDTGIPLGTVQ